MYRQSAFYAVVRAVVHCEDMLYGGNPSNTVLGHS